MNRSSRTKHCNFTRKFVCIFISHLSFSPPKKFVKWKHETLKSTRLHNPVCYDTTIPCSKVQFLDNVKDFRNFDARRKIFRELGILGIRSHLCENRWKIQKKNFESEKIVVTVKLCFFFYCILDVLLPNLITKSQYINKLNFQSQSSNAVILRKLSAQYFESEKPKTAKSLTTYQN